jgi:hypothetical protein
MRGGRDVLPVRVRRLRCWTRSYARTSSAGVGARWAWSPAQEGLTLRKGGQVVPVYPFERAYWRSYGGASPLICLDRKYLGNPTRAGGPICTTDYWPLCASVKARSGNTCSGLGHTRTCLAPAGSGGRQCAHEPCVSVPCSQAGYICGLGGQGAMPVAAVRGRGVSGCAHRSYCPCSLGAGTITVGLGGETAPDASGA